MAIYQCPQNLGNEGSPSSTPPEMKDCLLVEAGEALDEGAEKPYLQSLLEIETWERAHRSVMAATLAQEKNRKWLS